MYSAKALLQSKTFWLAAGQALLGGIVIFSSTYPAVGWLVVAKSVLDIVIRIYTSGPITSITPAV